MRRISRLALVAGATLLAGLTASVVPFVRPVTEEPVRADAVIVLSGDRGERLARAMELLERGVTTVLVFDGALDSQRGVELCKGGQRFEVICLLPDPDNTRAEARAAARLVEERGWRRVVVSTSNYHVTRSGLLFRRCLGADVDMVGGESPYRGFRLARAIAREWLAVAYVLAVERDC